MPCSVFGLLTPVVNDIWKAIKKHCGYCLQPGRQVAALQPSADGLRVHVVSINEQIQLGKRPMVQTTRWIQDANSVDADSRTIIDKFEGRRKHMLDCSWNCCFNYKTGRDARKKNKQLDILRGALAPPYDSLFTSLKPVGQELQLPPDIMGQDQYKDKIVDCIEQGSNRLVGICGMGGAGKTTLLKQLNNNFAIPTADMQIFDHVIYVEIGQQPNLHTVQESIASQLGLTLGKDGITRSATLFNFLKEKKFLLLMDNLWKPLVLENVGIPIPVIRQDQIGNPNRQMIVITTRDDQICKRMQSQSKVVVLQRLKPEEAWRLFEANADFNRETNTNAQIGVCAQSIVHKCAGLPLAIKIVGKALTSRKSEQEWEYVVGLLHRSEFHHVPDANAEAELYNVLYISYEQLDARAKQCFLFLALKQDAVYVPYAIRLWMGHGLLDEANGTRSNELSGHAAAGCLKRACLLEESARGPDYLSMHDIIKGLALWIVQSKQGDGPSNNWLLCKGDETIKSEEWCTAHRISLRNLNEEVVIPGSIPCPLLLTLMITRSSISSNVPIGFFSNASSITFLDISDSNIQELPSDVGKLVNLQHFDVSKNPILSIPRELQQLKILRYLYFGYTPLKKFPDGIISALTMLRVLDLYYCGAQDTITEAHVKELESLACLTLGITIGDYNSLQRVLNLPKVSLKALCLKEARTWTRPHIAPALLITKRVSELERLTLDSMDNLEELCKGDTIVDSKWCFTKLDELRLLNLRKLKGVIWEGVVPHACFPKLRQLLISDCHSIRTVSWIKQLPCLEEVFLLQCNSMLELVAEAEGGGTTSSSAAHSFPRLRVLGLSGLPELSSICDDTLAFPCLKRLLVCECPKLAKLPSGLHNKERVPVILARQDWWDQLDWQNSSMESTLKSFFIELPSSFQGTALEIFKALAH